MIARGLIWLRDTAGGVYELLRLAALTRCRFRGNYWRWRFATAFGRGVPHSRLELIMHAVDYGRWIRHLRRWSR